MSRKRYSIGQLYVKIKGTMKYFFIVFFCFFLLPQQILAHIGGLPILKMNGQYAKVYPPQSVSTSIFDLPSGTDLAPENYLIHQPISFSIDISKLSIPQDILSQTNITWDFGDGTKPATIKNGFGNKHTYNKIGTYVLQITADYTATGGQDLGQQPLEAVLLYVLPYKNYHLPKAVIMVNERTDTTTNALDFDLNNEITFDGSKSQNGSLAITSYEWDFGDGTSSTMQKVEHRYKLPQYYATPLLRVRDANGFFSDGYITIRNSGKNEPNDPDRDEFIAESIKIVLTVCIFIIIVTFFWIKKRKKSH
jgi:hypothetical protein